MSLNFKMENLPFRLAQVFTASAMVAGLLVETLGVAQYGTSLVHEWQGDTSPANAELYLDGLRNMHGGSGFVLLAVSGLCMMALAGGLHKANKR